VTVRSIPELTRRRRRVSAPCASDAEIKVTGRHCGASSAAIGPMLRMGLTAGAIGCWQETCAPMPASGQESSVMGQPSGRWKGSGQLPGDQTVATPLDRWLACSRGGRIGLSSGNPRHKESEMTGRSSGKHRAPRIRVVPRSSSGPKGRQATAGPKASDLIDRAGDAHASLRPPWRTAHR
jgi:hypothetical protein